MYRIASEVDRRGVSSKTEVIDSARIPIVKVRDRTSGIMVDISFAAASGLVTRALINDLITRYPAVRPLVMVLKYFLIQVRRWRHMRSEALASGHVQKTAHRCTRARICFHSCPRPAAWTQRDVHRRRWELHARVDGRSHRPGEQFVMYDDHRSCTCRH